MLRDDPEAITPNTMIDTIKTTARIHSLKLGFSKKESAKVYLLASLDIDPLNDHETYSPSVFISLEDLAIQSNWNSLLEGLEVDDQLTISTTLLPQLGIIKDHFLNKEIEVILWSELKELTKEKKNSDGILMTHEERTQAHAELSPLYASFVPAQKEELQTLRDLRSIESEIRSIELKAKYEERKAHLENLKTAALAKLASPAPAKKTTKKASK